MWWRRLSWAIHTNCWVLFESMWKLGRSVICRKEEPMKYFCPQSIDPMDKDSLFGQNGRSYASRSQPAAFMERAERRESLCSGMIAKVFFLATWVRRCLSLSHPLLLPHHLSNGSSFRVPSVTTVHKQVGGAKKGLGMVSVGEQAILPAFPLSLPLSLERLQRCETHDISFLNCGWVDAVYWHTYLSCVSACVSIHWVSSSKLRMRAILTGIWILFAHLSEIDETLSFNVPFFFNSFLFILKRWCTPVFFFFIVCLFVFLFGTCLNLEWFNRWMGWFIPSLFFVFILLFLDPNIYNCDEFERLWSECECFVLLSSHQFFSRFRVDLMLHSAPNDTFPPSQWHFLSRFNSTSPPPPPPHPRRMHLLYTLTKHISSKCICYFFLWLFGVFFLCCMLMKCHYSWGEHARKCHQIKHLEMRKETDLSGCVFKCFWMQFWKHTNDMGVCHDTVYNFLYLFN